MRDMVKISSLQTLLWRVTEEMIVLVQYFLLAHICACYYCPHWFWNIEPLRHPNGPFLVPQDPSGCHNKSIATDCHSPPFLSPLCHYCYGSAGLSMDLCISEVKLTVGITPGLMSGVESKGSGVWVVEVWVFRVSRGWFCDGSKVW